MHRSLAILSSLSVIAAACAMGCSSKATGSQGGATCDTSMPVSFKTDVIPAFQQNCTVSQSCHGQMNNSGEENLFLGFDVGMGTTDPMAVYSMLVGVHSEEDPAMNLVTAGDLSTSYLWQKLQNTQNNFASACAKATCIDCNADSPCGGLMPYDGELLAMTDPQNLCSIQSWITQGAKNN
jgi:hypothetical protein